MWQLQCWIHTRALQIKAMASCHHMLNHGGDVSPAAAASSRHFNPGHQGCPVEPPAVTTFNPAALHGRIESRAATRPDSLHLSCQASRRLSLTLLGCGT